MADLTITVDERLLKHARMRALNDGTSVNALLRSYWSDTRAMGMPKRVAELCRAGGPERRVEWRGWSNLDPG